MEPNKQNQNLKHCIETKLKINVTCDVYNL